MPHSTYRPEWMGHASLTPEGSYEAGSFASLELTYTAGRFGMDDTASLKIAFRFAGDMGRLQFDDPQAANYTSVAASNHAVLEYRYDPKGNIRPWDKTLYIKVVRGFLAEGDRIVVRFGDPCQGSPGWRLQTFCEPTFEFRVLVDAIATYNYVELPQSPTIAIVPGPPATWRAILPTTCRCNEPFCLCVKAEDRWGNPSDQVAETLSLRPSTGVHGLPREVVFRPGQFTAVSDDLRVASPADLTIDVVDAGGQVLTTSNPLRVVASTDLLPYWGDLHGQSEETIGTNSARQYFTFARDFALLDICGHQGNDFQITKEFWRELNALTAQFDEPGRFVALPGYEWSGNTALGGDRNVFFRHEGRPIRRSSHALVDDVSDADTDCHTAAELFTALEADDEDAVVIAHVGGRYADLHAAHDGRLERSVEIHSAWGTFEWLLADAIELGHRVGIVCNSDGHKGRPGASYPGASWFGAYGGLTCFLMPQLSRDALFDCLRRRRHYGTTGARLYLDVKARFEGSARRFEEDPKFGPAPSHPVDEAMMGDIIHTTDAAVLLNVSVLGSAPIERVEIFSGLRPISTVRPHHESAADGHRIRVLWEGAEYRGRFRQTAWDGTARVTQNRIRRTKAINFWNPEKRLVQNGPAELTWQATTTGNFGGFDMWLEHPTEGTLRVKTPLVELEVPIAEIGVKDREFDAGKLGRRLRLFRLPDENRHRQCDIAQRVTVRPGVDNPLYIRVTQEDGHRAWSSPIWLIPAPP